MRGIKAEGGWGVVCTEEVEIHPTSDLAPYVEGRLWDDADVPGLRLMTDAVHEHGVARRHRADPRRARRGQPLLAA